MESTISRYTEKRIFRRLDTELLVYLISGGKTIEVTSSNISCGGMFLKINPNEVAEEEVNMWVHLPNQQTPVKLVGEIRRIEKNQDRPGIGVEFQGLYNDSILAIDSYIKSNLN